MQKKPTKLKQHKNDFERMFQVCSEHNSSVNYPYSLHARFNAPPPETPAEVLCEMSTVIP